ncbi:HutD/Ves family protein [Cupriavidus gilardii]|uniref:HutD/Ves family protein n=1 Tax=Cupriavidus gilardii TaxID=82541 RepID=UPI0015733147|nr:HutD family protein [Cupriavidus gilardii]NSX02307.1 HutD family protein [Cupriavidus gilardii]
MSAAPSLSLQRRRFALTELTPMPWKNGGGTTREIAAWPPAAGLDTFDWRLSIADIAADGPFSAFPGIDRQIVLLDGDGVRLRARDGSFDHRLSAVGEPFAFAGETTVDATLLGGPTRDFNVMTRRGSCHASVASTGAAIDSADIHADTTVVLYVLAGTWRCADARRADADVLTAGSGMLLPPDSAFRWRAEGEDARCLVVKLQSSQSLQPPQPPQPSSFDRETT